MAEAQTQIEEERGPQTKSETKKKPEGRRFWLISFIILLILGSIGGVGYFLFFSDNQATSANNTEDSIVNQEFIESPPLFMPPMNFQVNLSDGRRFLVVDIRLEVMNIQTSDFINARIPVVNDIVISTLQRKTFDELRKGSGVDQLKRDLKRRLNSGKLFTEEFIAFNRNTNPIEEIYFDRFILQ